VSLDLTYSIHLLSSSYSRESPSRFKKELIKALGSPSSSAIEIDSLNQMLINIGRPDERLSENDLDLLLKEAGVNDQRSIPVEKFVQLM
jgi:Ca2+-binding EF-hand superfamily protein